MVERVAMVRHQAGYGTVHDCTTDNETHRIVSITKDIRCRWLYLLSNLKVFIR
ncbi:unnamed protein product [Anisakis simplex]|uniref:Uncharacterized protein n=1 Tax=Anisakis simplex TaxID=6269 RepID=A0A0M3KJF0_ANISI|nr:unnamed protein product [Anisakis simplex]